MFRILVATAVAITLASAGAFAIMRRRTPKSGSPAPMGRPAT